MNQVLLIMTAVVLGGCAATGPVKGEPVPATVVRVNDGVRIVWISKAGANYQVQASSDKGSWQNVGKPRALKGTGFGDVVVPDVQYLRVIRID